MYKESKFLIKDRCDNDYDNNELSMCGILDVIHEESGTFRFTDTWKDRVVSDINWIEVGEEYEAYGQLEYVDFKLFTVKRIV